LDHLKIERVYNFRYFKKNKFEYWTKMVLGTFPTAVYYSEASHCSKKTEKYWSVQYLAAENLSANCERIWTRSLCLSIPSLYIEIIKDLKNSPHRKWMKYIAARMHLTEGHCTRWIFQESYDGSHITGAVYISKSIQTRSSSFQAVNLMLIK